MTGTTVPSPRTRAARSTAFTLIELLVVIAVIALLISILLPGLRRARLEGMKAVSLANCRSLGQAGASYASEQKDQLPVVPTGVPVPDPINAFITWGGWGKNTSTWWALGGGGIFDIPPNARPLNSYLTSELLPPRPVPATNAAARKIFQMPALHDPSDKIGHQQQWDAFEPTFGTANPNTDGSSCYDDVGTSYLLQIKWFNQTVLAVGGSWTRAWRLGASRLRLADNFQPSRFIWVNDEYCDITINQPSDAAKIVNGYGDINKAIVTFLDGHSRYMKMIPGGESDPNRLTRPWLVRAYSNEEYTVVFPDLKQ